MKDSIKSHVFWMRLSTILIFGFFVLCLNASEDKEIITAIILINREAELVEMDEDGEILRRHVTIPDYFTSGRSHQSSLRQSLRKIKDYGLNDDHTLPGSSSLPSKCLQSFMKSLMAEEPGECCQETETSIYGAISYQHPASQTHLSNNYMPNQSANKTWMIRRNTVKPRVIRFRYKSLQAA